MRKLLLLGLLIIVPTISLADDNSKSNDGTMPVPLTRPDAKRAMEELKQRKLRFELPPITDAEKEKAADNERGLSYESRLRSLYLGDSGRGSASGFGSRDPDPKTSLDNQFKVQLFWIVSRTNNCLY